VVESAGAEDRLFEPVRANEIVDLEPFLTELEWVNGSLQDMCEKDSGD
jgi:hypothetical protein